MDPIKSFMVPSEKFITVERDPRGDKKRGRESFLGRV
jgi:hypothetical protein